MAKCFFSQYNLRRGGVFDFLRRRRMTRRTRRIWLWVFHWIIIIRGLIQEKGTGLLY
jgi:hypothetical protein